MRLVWSLSLCAMTAVGVAAAPEDVAAITDGVGELFTAGGLPNTVVAFGEQAFVVVSCGAGRQRAPLFVAARHGRGRVFAGGHDSFFGQGAIGDPDNRRLLVNTVSWLGGKPTGLRVLRYGTDMVLAPLTEAGHQAAAVDRREFVEGLATADVAIVSGISISGQDDVINALAAFVERGGGLLIQTVAWGWQQLNPGRDILRELGGNVLCTRMGLAWPDATAEGTSPDRFAVDGVGLELTQARVALAALVAHVNGTRPLEPPAMAQVSQTLTDTVRSLPLDHPFVTGLDTISRQAGGDALPTEQAPIKLDNPFARIRAQLEWQSIGRTEPEQQRAHPAAAAFPGAVPETAERVTRSVSVDLNQPAWHSTGLYAAPGELITVTVPEDAAALGLGVRIGCHTDGIWHLDQWRRFPEITLQRPIRAARTTIANPFGGLVYVVVPGNAPERVIDVAIAGAVEAPLFEYGKTPLSEWRRAIRERPAPWGEFATDKVVFSVPSRVLRTLEDPEKLCAFWNDVMDCAAELAQIPLERDRPERYVPDVQISAGYMHSGYPIMTWMDQPEIMVDRDRLMREGSWGMFHEMGHNHQSGHWTFGGTGEVTVNLFSLFILERACDTTVPLHPAIAGDEREKKLAAYLAAGAKFSDWQSDPFLALVMYYQLKEAFGWGAFKRVFAGYRDAPEAELPRNDDDKRDQWMIRFSREVGYDLGPFFQRWGVPTSEAARADIADLPDWMPEEFGG